MDIQPRRRPRPRPRVHSQFNRPVEFRESLGAAQARPTARTLDRQQLGALILSAIVAAIVFIALSYLTHRLANNTATLGSTPGATGISLQRGGLNAKGLQAARTIAASADSAPTGTRPGVPAVSGMNSGFGDGYALQGSVGTAAIRHPVATQ